jgi:hypothetical protein
LLLWLFLRPRANTYPDRTLSEWVWSILNGSDMKCGWLKDRFGLSWQIVPACLPDVIKHPKALQAHASDEEAPYRGAGTRCARVTGTLQWRFRLRPKGCIS